MCVGGVRAHAGFPQIQLSFFRRFSDYLCLGDAQAQAEKKTYRVDQKMLHSDFIAMAAPCIILRYQRRNSNIQ